MCACECWEAACYGWVDWLPGATLSSVRANTMNLLACKTLLLRPKLAHNQKGDESKEKIQICCSNLSDSLFSSVFLRVFLLLLLSRAAAGVGGAGGATVTAATDLSHI